MKFNRVALLGATERALADDRASFDREEAKRASEGTRKLAEWLTESGPKWLDFAEHVVYLVGNGYPVTESDMPRNSTTRPYYSGVCYGHESWLTPPDSREYHAPSELVNLRNVLRYSEDDQVTTSGLKGLGVEPMRTVLRFL